MTIASIYLRPLDPARDAEALHAILGDDASCHYMGGPATASVIETQRLLAKWTDGTEDTSWAIVDAPDGAALGRVTMIPRGERIWEAGVMVAPAMQGRGLATAALAEAIDIVFDKPAARRIYADIDPDNAPCIRAFEKLGFQKEGRLRATWKTHIGVRDSVIYGLIDTDKRQWKG